MPHAVDRRLPPRMALALAIVAVSTGALFIRLADAPPLVVAFWRCALATAVLAAIGWRSCVRELPRLGARERLVALAGGLVLALHFAAWISSLSYTTVAASAVLGNTTPLWVALLTPFLSGDRLGRGTLVAVAISVLGGILIGIGDLDLSASALLGDGLALIGAWMTALYLLVGRRLRRELTLVPYLVACYGTAAVILLGIVVASGQRVLGYGAQTYGWLVLLALVPQLLGHSAYNYALRYLSAAAVAVATLGEAFGAPLLAWFFLAETPPTLTLVGGAVVLAGVVLAIRSERAAG